MAYLAIGHENEGGYAPDTTNIVLKFETDAKKRAFVDKFERFQEAERRYLSKSDLREFISANSGMFVEMLDVDKMDFMYWD